MKFLIYEYNVSCGSRQISLKYMTPPVLVRETGQKFEKEYFDNIFFVLVFFLSFNGTSRELDRTQREKSRTDRDIKILLDL